MTFVAEFIVLGKPVPKSRPRFDPRSGRVYPVTKSKTYEQRVAAEAFSAARWERLRLDPVTVAIHRRDPPWPKPYDCARARPTRRAGKSTKCACAWCASSVEVELMIYLPDKRTRDLDNIEKSLLDGMNGVLFRDDRQVRAVSKRGQLDRANPRVEVVVQLIPPAQGGLALEPIVELVQCSSCEGRGGFEVTLPVSGEKREVVCVDCAGTGRAQT